MNAKYFLDTNIFVYSFDAKSPAKQKRAQALIEQALMDGLGTISFQVLQEFCNVALKKFEKPLSIRECKAYIAEVLEPLCNAFPGTDLYRLALDIREEAGLGFYDSLIVASAVQGGCKLIYSEDFQNGRKIAGTVIQNPF